MYLVMLCMLLTSMDLVLLSEVLLVQMKWCVGGVSVRGVVGADEAGGECLSS